MSTRRVIPIKQRLVLAIVVAVVVIVGVVATSAVLQSKPLPVELPATPTADGSLLTQDPPISTP